MSEMPVLDHKKLVYRDQTEIERMIKLYFSGPKVFECVVEHEDDFSCCRMETFELTVQFLAKAYCPTGNVLLVNLSDDSERPR